MRSLRDRFEDKYMPEPNSGCWLWMGAKSPSGYGKICLGSRVEDGTARAHRVSWELYKGPIPNGALICHHCDVPLCVNPDHLFCGTPKDNTQDMIRKGRRVQSDVRGERCGRAVLTEIDVLDIRTKRVSNADFSQIYGVSSSTISKIIHRSRWGHVA